MANCCSPKDDGRFIGSPNIKCRARHQGGSGGANSGAFIIINGGTRRQLLLDCDERGDGWDGVVLIGRRAFVVVVRDGGDQSMSGSGIVGNEERGFFPCNF